MELNDILAIAHKGNASDIHMKAGLPPMFRIDGALVPLKDAQRLTPEEVQRLVFSIMTNFQKERFRVQNELDMAHGVPGLGRFRVNVFQQRGSLGAVFRVIPLQIQTLAQLGLPKVIESISLEQRGLVLVTGATGSGKSTTLAAMIDHINTNRTAHLLTIEDPIEFLIRDKRSIVNQREVGVDTPSFASALRSSLRQDPDVILVGEMRDIETIEIALTAAETGHLVMSTLHTVDATESITRIVSVFPPHQQKQIRMQLASTLRAVISQRLVPRADGRGRIAAMEVLRATARVRELIEQEDHTKEIPEAIAGGHITYGMQSFDQSLMAHLQAGTITYQEALRQSSNPDDFALRVSGISGTSDSSWDGFEGPSAGTGAPSRKPGAPARPAAAQPQPPAPPRRTTGPQPQQAAPATGQRPAAKPDELEIERF
ncbi:MAG TPA: type IV pilus twitching motility protein PilT [Myxococcota bacterium]|nr:type IV pilus twitching motility protein PilT [Myxococcota bacterium]